MADATYNVIELTPDGAAQTTVNLTDMVVTLVTRYNYSAAAWFLDILDSDGVALLNGQLLTPNVDILAPYPDIKDLIGALVLVELNDGDYMSPDLLGINTALLWYAPGVDVVLQ